MLSLNRIFPRTEAFEAFCAPARRGPELWRKLLGVVAFLGVYISVVFWTILAPAGVFRRFGFADQLLDASASRSMLILLASFGAAWIAGFAILASIHRQPFGSLFGPRRRWRRDFVFAAFGMTVYALVIVAVVLALSDVGAVRSELGFGRWAALMVVALPLIAVQTGAEELFFRGYLQQRLAARFRSPWAWAVAPSVLFGAVHWEPSVYGAAAPLVIASITLVALILAAVTARTGALWAAWGLHFGTNVVALTLFGLQGSLSGLALWIAPRDEALIRLGAATDLIGLVIGGLALIHVMDRAVRRSPPGG